jgi:predicted alpha/beta-hydrolase family hydrolase
LLNAQGIEVWTANFAFMQLTLQGKRQVAPRADKLVAELAQMIATVVSAGNELPLWLAGKSLGGRVVSLYLSGAAVDRQVAGAVVFGYPLCPPAKAKDQAQAALAIAARSQCLQQLQRPVLICQGSRDAFGSATALQAFAGAAEVMELPGADHDYALPKRAGLAAEQAFRLAATAAGEFIRRQR